MKKMAKGDKVLIYHSVGPKEVVGIAEVCKEHYPDPTDDTGKWVWVDVKPVKKLKQVVTLAQIKDTAALKDIALVKQARLSVMPLTKKEYEYILKMSEN